MSLRLRVLIALALALLTSAAVGAGLAGVRARQSLREELVAAMVSGQQSAGRALEDLPRSVQPADDLARLVSTFDSNRHLTVRWERPGGAVAAASAPSPAGATPRWFANLYRVDPPARRIETPGYGALVLTPDARADVSALWAQFQALMLGLAVVLILGAGLAWLMVGRALRPVSTLSAAFERIGSGDYQAKVRAEGPLELARLARGVNEMAGRLAAVQARNRALEEQVLTLQDEERADLARDLHDEIGPHLFAANLDAALTLRLIEDGRAADAAEPVGRIQAAVAHMQRLVRDILERLRPTPLIEMGLAGAIGDLVAFWRARHPAIAFEVRLPDGEADLSDAVQEAIYRLVQEGLANAVRHGRPSRIEVEVALSGEDEVTARVSDNGVAAGPPRDTGFGLKGMRERVAQAGGTLAIDQGGEAGGWRILARLPRQGEGSLAA